MLTGCRTCGSPRSSANPMIHRGGAASQGGGNCLEVSECGSEVLDDLPCNDASLIQDRLGMHRPIGRIEIGCRAAYEEHCAIQRRAHHSASTRGESRNIVRSSLSVFPVGTWIQSVQPLREFPTSLDSAVEGARKWPAEVSRPPELVTMAWKVSPERTF